MASTNPPQAHPAASASSLKALDATRQRLQQLSASLNTLLYTLNSSTSLPPWETLQSTADLAAHQLQTLSAQLTAPGTASILNSAHAYPLPSFADNSHENMVQMMLRAKPEPDVERWCDEGRARGRAVVGAGANGTKEGKAQLDMAGWKKLWATAADLAIGVSQDLPWGMDYTLEERDRLANGEEVVTGLKRELDDGMEEEGSDDEEDDDEAGDAAITKAEHAERLRMRREKAVERTKQKQLDAKDLRPPAPLEDLMRFMNSGVVSPALAAAGSAP